MHLYKCTLPEGFYWGKFLQQIPRASLWQYWREKRTRKNNNNNKNYETNRTGEIPNKTTLNLQQQLMVVFHPQLQGELHQLQEISQVHETQEVCKHGFKYLRTSRNLSAGGKGGTRILRGNGVGDQSSSTKYKRGTIANWCTTSEEIQEYYRAVWWIW